MTSKQALKCIILGTNIDKNRSSIEEIDKAIETIEKELEVLEIFKKEMSIKTDYIVTEKYDIKYEYVEFYISSLYEKFKEDFKKIKEWLEND